MSDGKDDNVTDLRKGNQKPDILATAKSAIDKARKESFEAKVKDKLKVLEEHKKGVKLVEKEIAELIEEFESGL
jgi:hypothetical protein